jgi:hypothetical protein
MLSLFIYGNNYLWHFGDGITSKVKNPIHIYQNPGVYSVSLFYSNGFCDSTLVKNHYIQVVDAPKPGFNVSSRQGCAPFLVTFTDTVQMNVKQKDYFCLTCPIFVLHKNIQNIAMLLQIYPFIYIIQNFLWQQINLIF